MPPQEQVWVEFVFVRNNVTYDCAVIRGWDEQPDGTYKLESIKSAKSRVVWQALWRPYSERPV